MSLYEQFRALPDVNQKPSYSGQKILNLAPSQYPGGIAMWGALPAVYNTSTAPDEQGVHVHARMKSGGVKAIDETFDLVRVELPNRDGGQAYFEVNGDDAARYNVATILRVPLTYLQCPECHNVHSDVDFDLVHPHQNHICESCGVSWTSSAPCVSNPIMLLRECCGDTLRNRPVLDPVGRTINQRQSHFPGGIQIWGSNPAVVWTSPKQEEGGLHFHAFKTSKEWPDVDETYGAITLDGISLDAEAVRHIMAQHALPFLSAQILSLLCPSCGQPHFDRFAEAISPHREHHCEHCHATFPSPEATPLAVSNPILTCLARLREIWDHR